jgi:hypothetical protein
MSYGWTLSTQVSSVSRIKSCLGWPLNGTSIPVTIGHRWRWGTDGKRYFTWDHRLFPDPIKMQESLAAQGRKMVTIIDPHIKRDNNFKIHSEATAKVAFKLATLGLPSRPSCVSRSSYGDTGAYDRIAGPLHQG